MKFNLISFILFIAAVTARADMIIEQQSVEKSLTNHVSIKVHGDRMRMDTVGQ